MACEECGDAGWVWGLTPYMTRVKDPCPECGGKGVEGKYGTITASKKRFHPGEPLFIFRATDPLAPEAIRRYAELCQLEGCELTHCAEVRAHAARIEEWQKQHPELVKARPD